MSRQNVVVTGKAARGGPLSAYHLPASCDISITIC